MSCLARTAGVDRFKLPRDLSKGGRIKVKTPTAHSGIPVDLGWIEAKAQYLWANEYILEHASYKDRVIMPNQGLSNDV